MSTDYTKLTTGQIAEYINAMYDNDDSRARVILGQLDGRKRHASNYNLAGIANHVATKAQQFNPTPVHLMSPADRHAYSKHCQEVLKETIPNYFDPSK